LGYERLINWGTQATSSFPHNYHLLIFRLLKSMECKCWSWQWRNYHCKQYDPLTSIHYQPP